MGVMLPINVSCLCVKSVILYARNYMFRVGCYSILRLSCHSVRYYSIVKGNHVFITYYLVVKTNHVFVRYYSMD